MKTESIWSNCHAYRWFGLTIGNSREPTKRLNKRIQWWSKTEGNIQLVEQKPVG